MVESIGDGIIAMDAARRIVLINRAAETMLGVQAPRRGRPADHRCALRLRRAGQRSPM